MTGISKIGWPGIVVVEGPEDACLQYCQMLSRLRWKLMNVRGEQRLTLGPNDSVDQARVFPRGMQEFGPKDMSAAADACRHAGLEDLFLTALKIYKK